jgi:tetratricopeptide (TPR) repeat protein
VRVVRAVLTELTRAHMLDETEPGTFTLHDLLAAYAGELAIDHDAPDDRDSAVARILDHYLHTACAASAILDPYRDPIRIDPAVPGTVVTVPVDRPQALAWFTSRREALLSAVRISADVSPARAWRLAWAVSTFLDITGRWDLRLDSMRVALDAARRVEDVEAQAHAHRGMGFAGLRLGELSTAHQHLDRAAELYRRVGDQVGEANTLLNRAQVFGRERRSREALDRGQEALRLYRANGHRVGEALARNSIGWHNALLDRPAEALGQCLKALAILQELGDLLGVANAWDSVGFAHHRLGHYEDAETAYRQALELFADLGDRFNRAITLQNLAETYEAAGRRGEARAAWQEALTILESLRHSDAARLRNKVAAWA